MMTWEELVAIHAAMEPPKPVFYRLYYNEQGRPIVYSMEDLPGNYIEIDKDTYHLGPTNVKVVNGGIVYLTLKHSEKLRPGEQGTACHPRDVAVIDTNSTSLWSKHFYDKQN